MYTEYVLQTRTVADRCTDVPVWQRQLIPYTVSVEVHLPNIQACSLVSISELCFNGEIAQLSEDKMLYIECRPGSPWYIIRTDLLNLYSGYHLYCMEFIDTVTNELSQAYFGYTVSGVRNNRYKYMDRER